jgi:MoaA/NifB/PqqE/SkfB family radical SAM enzyme
MRAFSYLYFAKFWIKAALFKKKDPIIGSIIITDRCNLRCKHCSVNNITEIVYPYTQIKKDMQTLYDLGVRILFLYGGEPFLWKDGGLTVREIW